MKQREIPQDEKLTDEALAQWAQAFGLSPRATAWPVRPAR
jgi:hypothetical protein